MKWTLILLLFVYIPSFGQNTISFTNNNPPPKASLSDVAWIAGHWKGRGLWRNNRGNMESTFGRFHDVRV